MYRPTDFDAHPMYLLFQGGGPSQKSACRVLGPFCRVRIGTMAVWGLTRIGEESVRVATVALSGVGWELDGFEDPPWGDVTITSPSTPTTAREIEAAHGWIKPRTPPPPGQPS